MGEVYRAEDSKLGREVAIKVLPEAVAQDPERLARFAREAKVLASLNHQYIAGIHQVEEVEGQHFLVMELAEGETLQELIAKGAVPLKETARIGLEIAEALEAAHDRGIVHRDLKPANVKITPDGTVKVLDFGLAKALEDERDPADMGNSPTLTAAATQAGIIMGTAAYMSPEQAAGSITDRRADIWSFGVVLTEMLTGQQQFQGETVSHVLASVLKDEPGLDDLPESVPDRLRRLLERCLSKDPKKRLQSIGEARIVLGEYVSDPETFIASVAPPAIAVEPQPAWKRIVPWTAAAILAVALAASLVSHWRVPEQTKPLRRLSVAVGTNAPFMSGYGSSVIISPDGSQIGYVTGDIGNTEITLRPLDRWDTTSAVGESEVGLPYHPFFSPDGQWLGYVTRSEMKKLPVTGGTPITLCEVNLSRGASWGMDGRIVFAPNPGSGLSSIADVGGEPEPLTELLEGEVTHRWPQVLDDRNAIIFTAHTSASDFDNASIEALDLETGERKTIHHGATSARYSPSGHLLYANQGSLFAAAFDLETLEIVGPPAPVLAGLGSNTSEGGAHYSLAADGTLVYISGELSGAANFVTHWMDREGNATVLWPEALLGFNPRLSPDGQWLAFQKFEDGQRDIWIYDLERDVPMRLTFSDRNDTFPIWTPDGQFILFGSDRDGDSSLYRKSADGTGEAERLTTAESPQNPLSISPDGLRVVYVEVDPEEGANLWMLPLQEGGEPEPFLSTPFNEYGARFSPDGLWLAYGSDESGQWEVYVRSGTGGRGKWQVSADGGVWPFWSRSGDELFFRSLDGGTWTADIDTGESSFRASRPRQVLDPGPLLLPTGNAMEISPDGERFIVFLSEQSQDPTAREELRIVLNWTQELERKLPRSP